MISPRLAEFIKRQNWQNVVCEPIQGDASSRQYTRLKLPSLNKTYLVMETLSPKDDIILFEGIGHILAKLGLSVPTVYQAEPENGLALIEDFGDITYEAAFRDGASPENLYREATDVLITLHRQFKPSQTVNLKLPTYNQDQFLEQVMLFADIVIPLLKSKVTSQDWLSFQEAWKSILPSALQVPQSLMLRDYHAGNLMVLPHRKGVQKCGVLDFQQAGPGPVSYDLVSLLEDARRDISPNLRESLIQYYLSAFPEIKVEDFRLSYAVLGALRHTRVIAVFLRAAKNLGKPQYLIHIPRVWKLLQNHLASPYLAPIRSWFEDFMALDQCEKTLALEIQEARKWA